MVKSTEGPLFRDTIGSSFNFSYTSISPSTDSVGEQALVRPHESMADYKISPYLVFENGAASISFDKVFKPKVSFIGF